MEFIPKTFKMIKNDYISSSTAFSILALFGFMIYFNATAKEIEVTNEQLGLVGLFFFSMLALRIFKIRSYFSKGFSAEATVYKVRNRKGKVKIKYSYEIENIKYTNDELFRNTNDTKFYAIDEKVNIMVKNNDYTKSIMIDMYI